MTWRKRVQVTKALQELPVQTHRVESTVHVHPRTALLTAVARKLESWEKAMCVMGSRAYCRGRHVSSCSVGTSRTRRKPLVNPSTEHIDKQMSNLTNS